MIERSDVLKIIFDSLQNLNEELDESERIEINEDTKLFGDGAELDSLALVSVIVDVETDITDLVGQSIALTDDRAMNEEISPFSDVTALTNYIMLLAGEL